MSNKELAIRNIDDLSEGGVLNTWVSNAKSEIEDPNNELDYLVYNAEKALEKLADFLDGRKCERQVFDGDKMALEMTTNIIFQLTGDFREAIVIVEKVIRSVKREVFMSVGVPFEESDVRRAITKVLKKRLRIK